MEEIKEKKNKNALKPVIQILYNNKDITTSIDKYVESVTYTDYEKDQSDELEIVLNDYDKLFQTSWYPSKGDKVSVKMGYKGQPLLNCGTFTIDEPELNLSPDGNKFVIRALAASINEKIRQKNSKSYRNKTLIDIAREIAKKHGYTVAGSAGFIKLPYEIQNKESDMAFLRRIAETYGYIFKLTDNVISFIQSDSLEASKPLSTIYRKDIKSASFRDCAAKTYTACTVKYLSPKTGKLVSYTARSNKKGVKSEVLKLDVQCATKEAAKAAALAGLKRGSKEVEADVEFKLGHSKAYAGVNFDVKFDIIHDGRFHITQSTHTVARENYETNIRIKKIA